MNRGLTTFARGVLYLVGTAAFAVCFILLPELIREEGVGKPLNLYLTFSFFAIAYLLATPFFVALYQTHQFLHLIDKKKAFSEHSIKVLQNIKVCSIIFSIMIVLVTIAGISIAKMIDPREDVTFIVPIGFTLMFVSSVIAVFVAVLQRLLLEAVAMKSENDLII